MKLAKELVKIAKTLSGVYFDGDEAYEREYKKTERVVKKLSRKFPKIDGIKVLSDWDNDPTSVVGLFLGDAAEGGEIDGLPAADYYITDPDWEFGVNPRLTKELDKLGYYAEWHDAGTLMAYPK